MKQIVANWILNLSEQEAASLQAYSSVFGLAVAILGFLCLIVQLSRIKKSLYRDALESLYGRTFEIHKTFIDHPHLRKYFYFYKNTNEKTPTEQDTIESADFGQVMNAAEMIVDFWEGLELQKDLMPEELVDAWRRYFSELRSASPALKVYLENHHNWHSNELLHQLGSPHVSSPSHGTVRNESVRVGITEPNQ